MTAAFAPAALAPPDPPSELGRPKDVCPTRGRARRLDLLWHIGERRVALEIKLRRITEWSGTFIDGSKLHPRAKVDAYSYTELKDIHRLERLTSVAAPDGPTSATDRFVLLLTNDPNEFEARVPHINLQLTDGATLLPGHRAQFNPVKRNGGQTSPNTLWHDYPPFLLVGKYNLNWIEMGDDVDRFQPKPPAKQPFPVSRLLLIRVEPQAAS